MRAFFLFISNFEIFRSAKKGVLPKLSLKLTFATPPIFVVLPETLFDQTTNPFSMSKFDFSLLCD